MQPSNYMASYNLAKHLIADRLGWDIDWLKTAIKSKVTDRLCEWYDQNKRDPLIEDAAKKDWCHFNEARSSIEDAVNDWCDENLFK